MRLDLVGYLPSHIQPRAHGIIVKYLSTQVVRVSSAPGLGGAGALLKDLLICNALQQGKANYTGAFFV